MVTGEEPHPETASVAVRGEPEDVDESPPEELLPLPAGVLAMREFPKSTTDIFTHAVTGIAVPVIV